MKSTGDPLIDALYSVRKGKVEYVDVPELGSSSSTVGATLVVRRSMTPFRLCTR